jgi:general stress protein 26
MNPKEIVLDFLKKNTLGILATVTVDGKPHADAVYYTIDSSFDISFLTETGTLKYTNVAHKNDVFFVVTDIESKITVHVKGKASLVRDKDSLTSMMNKVANMLNGGDSFDTVLPILKRDDGNLVVIKITPEEIRFSDYGVKGLVEETIEF